MHKFLLVVLIMVSAAACVLPLRESRDATEVDTALAGTAVDGSIVSGGLSRHYILHIPARYQPNQPTPLVINLHGFNSNAAQEEKLTGMSVKADEATFLAVYPDGMNQTWHDEPGANGQRDLQFVSDLVTTLQRNYSIDPRRIYATGISNGGGMANRLGCDMSNILAAIAPVSGAYSYWQDCNPTRAVPVLAFHGLDDQIVPYADGTSDGIYPAIEDWAAAWAKRDGCASNPLITVPTGTVTKRRWAGCNVGAEVVMYTLANDGHHWPGSLSMPERVTSQAINATEVMWDFFTMHPMP